MSLLTAQDKKIIKKNKGYYCPVRLFADRLFMVRKQFGKEGEENLKKELKKLGYDIEPYLKDKKMVPFHLFIAFLITEVKFFEYDEKKIRDLGREMVGISFIVRFASKYLTSLDMVTQNADKLWKKYMPGKLKVVEADKKEKRVVMEISKKPPIHPYFCKNLEGYLEKLFSLVVNQEAECYEEECFFEKRGKTHRFVVTW